MLQAPVVLFVLRDSTVGLNIGKGKLDESKLYYCPACRKLSYRSNFDGAHVEVVYANNRKLSIVPLCSGCNHRTGNFFVDSELLVPVPSNL